MSGRRNIYRSHYECMFRSLPLTMHTLEHTCHDPEHTTRTHRSNTIMASTSASSSSSSASRTVYVVTGSNTGVGFETARQLAVGDVNDDRHIILACRTPEKAQAAVEKIVKEIPEGRHTIVEWMRLDLADLRSIEAFIAEFERRSLPLHVLVNNAGLNTPPRLGQSTFHVDGQFVANYLGPFVLTRGLMPILERSQPSRVINVTSYMHRRGSIEFESACRKSNALGYSTSKLAQIFHAYELQRRYASKGVTFFLTHPGACNSDIWNTVRPIWFRHIIKPIARTLMLSTAQGAAPSVFAATKPLTALNASECEHFGPYPTKAGWEVCLDAWQPTYFTKVTKSKTSPVTYDPKIASDLMSLSEKLHDEWKQCAEKEEQQQ